MSKTIPSQCNRAVKLDPILAAQVDEVLKSQGAHFSEWVRMLMREYIRKWKYDQQSIGSKIESYRLEGEERVVFIRNRDHIRGMLNSLKKARKTTYEETVGPIEREVERLIKEEDNEGLEAIITSKPWLNNRKRLDGSIA